MVTVKIERTKGSNLLLLVVFYLLLVVCFTYVVKDFYFFQKVELTYKLSPFKFVLSFVSILFNVILLTIARVKDFLYSIGVLILIFFVFPSAILFSYVKDIDFRIFLSHNIFFLLTLSLGLIRIKFKSKKIEITQSKKLLSIIVSIGIIPFMILFIPYVNLKNLLLLEIYETRALMDERINNLYTDYTYSWFNKFIIPCLLVFGIYFRDRLIILICSLSLIFLFLCGAHKAVFFGLIFTFILYKYDYLKKMNYFIKILILTALASLFMSIILNNDFLMLISIRRAILLPGLIDILYFDLFKGNHLYWAETFNGLIRVYPYGYEHAYVIGKKYLDDINVGANNGIISDGFMNFGMIGVLINIIIVSVYISILNQLKISSRFFGLFFLFLFLVESTSLTTILLTHGGFILILLAFFFMKDTEEQMR